MKYILLQHWTGELDELCNLSSDANRAYAEQCGADYMLLRGEVFGWSLCPYMQKLNMLCKLWDDYDIVAMTDLDMFPRKGLKENLFTDVEGVGVCDEGNRKNTYARLLKNYPEYSSIKHPFWGGSIYRLEKHLRVLLRSQFKKIGPEWMWWNTKGSPVDEGIMHRLAMLADLPMKYMHLPDSWSRGHFHPKVNEAQFIHIRKGSRRPDGSVIDAAVTKMENYNTLAGLI